MTFLPCPTFTYAWLLWYPLALSICFAASSFALSTCLAASSFARSICFAASVLALSTCFIVSSLATSIVFWILWLNSAKSIDSADSCIMEKILSPQFIPSALPLSFLSSEDFLYLSPWFPWFSLSEKSNLSSWLLIYILLPYISLTISQILSFL